MLPAAGADWRSPQGSGHDVGGRVADLVARARAWLLLRWRAEVLSVRSIASPLARGASFDDWSREDYEMGITDKFSRLHATLVCSTVEARTRFFGSRALFTLPLHTTE